jgi:transposase-like protein
MANAANGTARLFRATSDAPSGWTRRFWECHLSGTNTRRLRGALAPLLRGTPLSKDAVSRLVGRLREDFTAWAQRDLGELKVRYLFLDGWYPRVRIGKKRIRCQCWSPWAYARADTG